MAEDGVLRIGICQFPVGNDPRRNGERIRDQMREAAEAGAHIAHFPECALSGHPGSQGSEWRGFDWETIGHEIRAILQEARRSGIWAAFGGAHTLTGEHKPHNSVYVINPRGEIEDRYDKRFLTQGELPYFSPGDRPTVFSLKGVRCGVYICYEKWFPELFCDYKRRGAQLLLDSISSQERDFSPRTDKQCLDDSERALWIAHARLNHLWISVSNHCRQDQDNTSFLVDPDGRLQKLPFKETCVRVFEVDTRRELWDPSGPFRDLALSGATHNGEVVDDPRSSDKRSP